jgi:hypothetical protein
MIPPFFIPAHGVTRKNADWYGFIIASLLELFNTYASCAVSATNEASALSDSLYPTIFLENKSMTTHILAKKRRFCQPTKALFHYAATVFFCNELQ